MSKTLVTGGLALAGIGLGAWAAMTTAGIDTQGLEDAERKLDTRMAALEANDTDRDASLDEMRRQLDRSRDLLSRSLQRLSVFSRLKL